MSDFDPEAFKQREIERYMADNSLEDLEHQIRTRRCGNCGKWMTKSCPQERNVRGMSRGPSGDHPGCSEIVPNWRIELVMEAATMKKLES